MGLRALFLAFFSLLAVAQAAPPVVYVIPVREEIGPTTAALVRRGVREASARHAAALVLALDTYGGRADAMEEVIRAVESFPQQEKTYAYVDPKAGSAGALIASSARHIVMAPGAVIGAATPILATDSGEVKALPESYEKKMLSFMDGMGRATAARHGHNPDVFTAMIDRGEGLRVGGTEILPKGKILTLTNTEAEKRYGQPPRPLLSEGTVPSLAAVAALAGGTEAEIVELKPTGFERIARFLVSIAPILLSAGMILAYLEFKAPGTMVCGILSALCFLLFFFGQYVAGLSGYEPAAFFLLGAALVGVELFLLPGLVVPVATGLLLILAAILTAMADLPPASHSLPTLAQLRLPLWKLTAALALSVGAIALLARYLPRAGFTRSLERATIVGAPVLDRPAAHVAVGEEGEAVTLLRPAGTAQFGGRRIDVVSDGAFVPAGARVRVAQVEGIRVIVRPV
ncbi:MAG: NfeD family protein [Verrucomicrobium sp.]|nr:NfeD family protein [Verrucomicrobium sp.]